jgi:hypothetical protein
MTACENNFFVDCGSIVKRDYLLEFINNEVLLFKSFINLGPGETLKEGYGTDSDVYLEYIEIAEIQNNVLHLKFYTHDSPCIQFTKRFSAKYSVNVQLIYYNSELNFSGKLSIHNQQIVLDEIWKYHQGLYYTDKDRFWDSIEEDPGINCDFLSPEDSMTLINLKFSKMM